MSIVRCFLTTKKSCRLQRQDWPPFHPPREPELLFIIRSEAVHWFNSTSMIVPSLKPSVATMVQVGQMNNWFVLPPSLEWSWLGTLRSWSCRPRLCQPSWTCQESPEQSLSQKKCLKRLGLTIFSLLIKNIGFFWYEGQTGTSKILPSQYLGMGGYYPPFSLLVHSRDLLGNRFGQVGHHLVEISQGEGLVLQSRCKKLSTWMYIQVSLACYLVC